MQGTTARSSWDFTPVFDLIHSLRTHHETSQPSGGERSRDQERRETETAEQITTRAIDSGLGNLDKVWDYLGVQRDSLPPSVPHFEVSTTGSSDKRDAAYTSDGALYYPASSKSVRWRGDSDGRDLTDVQPESTQETQLTKNQRKKKNRKLRKATEAGTRDSEIPRHNGFHDSSGSAQESDNSPPSPLSDHSIELPLRASSRTIGNESITHRHPSRSLTKSSKAENMPMTLVPITPTKTIKQNGVPKVNPSARIIASSAPSKQFNIDSINEARQKVAAALQSGKKAELDKAQSSSRTIHESLKKQWPVADPYAAFRLQPPMTPTPASRLQQPAVSVPSKGDFSTGTTIAVTSSAISPAPRGRHEILPLLNQSSIDRNWSLFLKVLHNFPGDRRYLVSPLQLSINRPQSNGIHVFVDASNIMIGFTEHLKRSRHIPMYAKVPQVELNFHALALLLERRRPVAKRVLAGSTPEVSAFEEARQVGYETCILDKVYKARELTERQKYFEQRDKGYASGSDGNGTDGSAQRRPKWVEQAVDEILHLKILESVIDTDVAAEAVDGGGSETPASAGRPTMVLATGDAAEAEYSPGFLKMVERALKRGWNVEVMAFGRSVSAGYRKMEEKPMDRGGWGERFKIIELDEYSEELFGERM